MSDHCDPFHKVLRLSHDVYHGRSLSAVGVALQELRIVTPAEASGATAVLNAAGWTYVAAALTAILQLLYFLMRAGLLGRRDE